MKCINVLYNLLIKGLDYYLVGRYIKLFYFILVAGIVLTIFCSLRITGMITFGREVAVAVFAPLMGAVIIGSIIGIIALRSYLKNPRPR